MEENAVTEKIIGAAIEMHRALGPGLLESVYEECLSIELEQRGLRVERQVYVPIEYKGHRVGADLKVDLLIERCVVVELKAIEKLLPVHGAQPEANQETDRVADQFQRSRFEGRCEASGQRPSGLCASASLC